MGGLAMLWVLRYQAWISEDVLQRRKHQENMAAHEAHSVSQAEGKARLDAIPGNWLIRERGAIQCDGPMNCCWRYTN